MYNGGKMGVVKDVLVDNARVVSYMRLDAA